MLKLKKSLIIAILAVCLALPLLASAQNAATNGDAPLIKRLQNVADKGGYVTDSTIASTPIIIGTIVGAFINFTGIVFIILMVIAGYSWMTASGNEEKTKKAMATIKTAIIGLVVSLSAWVIWNFVFEKLIL